VLAWRRTSARSTPAVRSLEGGRLVVYFPDADLCDGAAEVESRGYFDVHNCPPWGTWVGFFSEGPSTHECYANYLVSWVPPEFLELVSGAIHVNPEECIVWLDDSDVALRLLLSRAA